MRTNGGKGRKQTILCGRPKWMTIFTLQRTKDRDSICYDRIAFGDRRHRVVHISGSSVARGAQILRVLIRLPAKTRSRRHCISVIQWRRTMMWSIESWRTLAVKTFEGLGQRCRHCRVNYLSIQGCFPRMGTNNRNLHCFKNTGE